MAFDPSSNDQDPSVAERYNKERFYSLGCKSFDYFDQRGISKASRWFPSDLMSLISLVANSAAF